MRGAVARGGVGAAGGLAKVPGIAGDGAVSVGRNGALTPAVLSTTVATVKPAVGA